jgi:hypothetical protein
MANQITQTGTTVGPVIYNVWVNESPYAMFRVLDAELWMEFGQHDMFFIRIEIPRGTPLNSVSLWPDDAPVRIQWGRTPDLNMWYGYVNHHQITANADSGSHASQIEYVCIGTSSVLNSDTSRAWTSVSPTYIAKKIAAENNLRAVVSPITWVLDFEQQANESNFCFLNKVANKTGMRFWCSGGTVYMVQPDIQLLGSKVATPPVFYSNKLMTQQDTVRDFQILKGNNIPGSVVANRAIFGVDPTTGTPFSAVNTPTSGSTSRVIIKQDTPVSSYYDAKNRIDASAALSQFNIMANGQLFGNTSLYPGKVVNLQGLSLPTNMSGNWLLTRTHHKLRTQYQTNAAADVYVTDVSMVRNLPTGLNLVNVQPIMPEFATCTLSNKTWTCFKPNVITETVT